MSGETGGEREREREIRWEIGREREMSGETGGERERLACM